MAGNPKDYKNINDWAKTLTRADAEKIYNELNAAFDTPEARARAKRIQAQVKAEAEQKKKKTQAGKTQAKKKSKK